jgi:hypothetical protein
MFKNTRIAKHLPVLLAFTTLLTVACKAPQAVEKPSEASPAGPRSPLQSGDLRSHRIVEENGQFSVRVNPGTEGDAIKYLKDLKQSPHLRSFEGAFVGPNGELVSKLDDLIRYIGQDTSVTASQLESLSAQMLAEKGHRATRFFAPKIVNVQQSPIVDCTSSGGTLVNPDKKYGWRKVVRLAVQSGSGAKTDGMKALWVLFNYFSGVPSFPTKEPDAVQAILERAEAAQGEEHSVYFFVYTPPAYTIGLFLAASFDAGEAGDVDKKYYLPHACAQCHGSNENALAASKINYLDTDHWFDRIQPGDDFPDVPEDNVLPDGSVRGTAAFSAAFETIRFLNREIRTQNAAVGGGFQLRAVEKWLELHGSDPSHMSMFSRSISVSDPQWRADASPDRELLPLLNRYCFRCHSSLRFHVFDRQAVKVRKEFAQGLINGCDMPQDRQLDAVTKARFTSLLRELQ